VKTGRGGAPDTGRPGAGRLLTATLFRVARGECFGATGLFRQAAT
jgi:hypothetical protein